MKIKRIQEILQEAEKIDAAIVSYMNTDYSQVVFWGHNAWALKIGLCAFQKLLQKYHLARIVPIKDTCDLASDPEGCGIYDLINCFGEQIHACISENWHMDYEFMDDYIHNSNMDEAISNLEYKEFKKQMVEKYGEAFFPYFDNMYEYTVKDLIVFEETMILSNKKLYDFDKGFNGKLSRKKKAIYKKLTHYLSKLFTFSFDYSISCSERNESYFWIWSVGYASDIDDSVTYLHISFAALVSYILIDKFMNEVERK